MIRFSPLFFALCGFAVPATLAMQCKVVAAHTPSAGELAFLHAEYDNAAALYQAELQRHPDDGDSVVGLVRVLLREQKVDEALDAAKKGLSADPKSVAMMVALGEAEYRAGAPWQAAESANEAAKLDSCYPRLHLLFARLLGLNSMNASETREVRTAYSLDAHDPDIRWMWIATLPPAEKVVELEAYLGSPNGDNAEEHHRGILYLAELQKRAAEPSSPCHLASTSTATEMPFAAIMSDANHVRAFGLEVKLNGRGSRLEIDTGTSGILVSRSVAERAGLKPLVSAEIGTKSGYTAYVNSIQIGDLEFRDCIVRVLDERSVMTSDGQVGMNLFSNFLVTLDYPMRRLALSPLPLLPNDEAQKPSLVTNDESSDNPDQETISRGPRDRFIAPEMKDYVPVYRVGHNLFIATAVSSGSKKLFVLNSGSWATLISTSMAREIGNLHAAYQGKSLYGNVQVYTVNNVNLDFAGIRQPAREMLSMNLSDFSNRVGMEVSGYLGANTLSQLTTHIDYRDGLVKPGDPPALPGRQ